MGPIWDTSGQPAYGLTYMGPMPNPGEQDFSSFLGTDVSPFPNFNNSVLTTRRNLLLHC